MANYVSTHTGAEIDAAVDAAIHFEAVYGSTTYAEIKAAFDAGRTVSARKGFQHFQLGLFAASGVTFKSTNAAQKTITLLSVTNADVWSETVLDIGAELAAVQAASSPAILNTASGAVASFPDGSAAPLSACVVDITAVQAGSGDPYPAGGGKNKIDWKVNVYASAVPVTLKAGNYVLSAQSTLANGNWYISGTKSDNTMCTAAEMGVGTFAESSTPSVYYGVINEQYLAFTCPEDGVTFRFGKLNADGTIPAQVEAGSTPTDYAPYSNIRPITGWTGAKVTRAAKNLLNGASLSVYTNWGKDLFPYGSYPTNNNSRGYVLPVKAGAAYALSFGISGDSYPQYLYLVRGQGQTSERLKVFTNTNFIDDVYTFTAEEGWLYYIRLGSMSTESNFNTNWAKVSWAQIELGTAATPYEPYNGEAFTVSWQTEAGAVYGGTVDLVSGLLTVTAQKSVLTYAAASALPVANIGVDIAQSRTWVRNWLTPDYTNTAERRAGGINAACNYFKVSVNNTNIFASQYRTYFWTPDTVTDRDTFLALLQAIELGDDELYVINELATPQTYQLTAQTIEALKGVNNVWADCGDVKVTYRSDTELFFELKVPDAPTTDGTYTLTATVAGGVATYSWA